MKYDILTNVLFLVISYSYSVRKSVRTKTYTSINKKGTSSFLDLFFHKRQRIP